MEFQYGPGGGSAGVLDALAHVGSFTLEIYQETAPGVLTLRHVYAPAMGAPVRSIMHEGGARGGVGHFSALREDLSDL